MDDVLNSDIRPEFYITYFDIICSYNLLSPYCFRIIDLWKANIVLSSHRIEGKSGMSSRKVKEFLNRVKDTGNIENLPRIVIKRKTKPRDIK